MLAAPVVLLSLVATTDPAPTPFPEVEAAFAKLVKIAIVAPDDPRAFKESLNAKRKALEETTAALLPHTKVPAERVAAECRTGEATLAVADAIVAVPGPKGLTQEQNALFHEKLAEQAAPLFDVALYNFTSCAEGSDVWAQRCAAHVAALSVRLLDKKAAAAHPTTPTPTPTPTPAPPPATPSAAPASTRGSGGR